MLELLAIAMGLIVLTAISLPLLSGRPGRHLGAGLEGTSPREMWEEEKLRLLDQLRENDIALAEGRTDSESHIDVAERLSREAEAVVDRLRQARAHVDPAGTTQARRAALPTSIAGIILVAVAAGGAHYTASLSDIDATISPHDTVELPAPAEQRTVGEQVPDASPPLGEDGMPDVAAMVARLETRVHGGESTEDDIRMLLRSYRVMDRGEDALKVLQIAVARFPENVEFKMMWLRSTIQKADFEPSQALIATVDDVLARAPELLEAHWYRSLILARQGRTEEARDTLIWLQPRVADQPRVKEAVGALLGQLSTEQATQKETN